MSKDESLNVVIVGAGIGGLASAVLLSREGIGVTVLEQATALARVGAGISFGPNATRLLADMGLLEALRRVGSCPPAMRFLRWDDGTVLLETRLGAAAERHFGAPLVRCERADILAVLLEAVPSGSVEFGAHVASLAECPNGIEVILSSGRRLVADAVIAADGVRSMMRRQLTGVDDPEYSGTVVYRGLVPREQAAMVGVDLWSAQYYWLGSGCHVVAGALSDHTVDYNLSVERPEGAEESWTQIAKAEEALGYLDGWHAPVRKLVALSDEALRGAVFVRRAPEKWAFGRVALLGDAAHAMLPFEAQGGVQAIEDAVVLAGCLRGATAADVPKSLERFGALRMARAAEVQEASRRRGSILNVPDGPEQQKRDAWLRGLPRTQPWGTRQHIWEYDVRQSLVADRR